jgi:hypothetical protein
MYTRSGYSFSYAFFVHLIFPIFVLNANGAVRLEKYHFRRSGAFAEHHDSVHVEVIVFLYVSACYVPPAVRALLPI